MKNTETTIHELELECKKSEITVGENGKVFISMSSVPKDLFLEVLFDKFTFDEIFSELDEDTVMEEIGLNKMRDYVLEAVEAAKVGL